MSKARRRFHVTVEVFASPEWIEARTYTKHGLGIDVVWDYVNEVVEDHHDDVSMVVVGVEEKRRK